MQEAGNLEPEPEGNSRAEGAFDRVVLSSAIGLVTFNNSMKDVVQCYKGTYLPKLGELYAITVLRKHPDFHAFEFEVIAGFTRSKEIAERYLLYRFRWDGDRDLPERAIVEQAVEGLPGRFIRSFVENTWDKVFPDHPMHPFQLEDLDFKVFKKWVSSYADGNTTVDPYHAKEFVMRVKQAKSTLIEECARELSEYFNEYHRYLAQLRND